MAADTKDRQTPLILIGIGLAVYVLGAFIHPGPSGIVPTLLIDIVGAVIATAILIGAALLVSAVLSESFGEVRTAVPKFAGAVLVSGAIGVIIPFAGILSSVVFLGLIVWLFEVELVYAIALAVVNWIISFALFAHLFKT